MFLTTDTQHPTELHSLVGLCNGEAVCVLGERNLLLLFTLFGKLMYRSLLRAEVCIQDNIL